MRFCFSILFLLFTAVACSPSKTEIEKQEAEYDRIADSVLKSSMPVDSIQSVDTTATINK